MIKYSYPNIKTTDIEAFCNALMDAIDSQYIQKTDQKFVFGMLKRASKSLELVFIQDNIDYVMQEDYSIFYVDTIMKFSKSMHHFDEELSIQDKVARTVSEFDKDATNYEFINSKDNTMIQISDLVAGLLGRMFFFINSVSSYNEIRKKVIELNDIQVINCKHFNELRIKSNFHNKGFLHSTTTVGIIKRLDFFFDLVDGEYNRRGDLI